MYDTLKGIRRILHAVASENEPHLNYFTDCVAAYEAAKGNIPEGFPSIFGCLVALERIQKRTEVLRDVLVEEIQREAEDAVTLAVEVRDQSRVDPKFVLDDLSVVKTITSLAQKAEDVSVGNVHVMLESQVNRAKKLHERMKALFVPKK